MHMERRAGRGALSEGRNQDGLLPSLKLKPGARAKTPFCSHLEG